MGRVIRIGSRESRLAVVQAELVAKEIKRENPQFEIELVTMKTTGDRILDRSLDEIGGKGLFVKELDQALLDGRIDIAVHSLKDLPMRLARDLPILAYSKREDARDALICKPGSGLSGLAGDNGVIGTSSRRRKIQLQKLYPRASFRGIRGNVQTRLQKLAGEGYDATVLAVAGLCRLGMESVIGRVLEVDEVVPAAGQGILAVQGKADGDHAFLSLINNRESEWAALAERQFVAALDGGCTSAVAAHAKVRGNELCLTGLYCEDGSDEYFTDTLSGDVGQAQKLGEMLAERMK
jgi:hydroxymethylbilane synthase